ncbi:kynurenine-oxoglutarate transaminase [Loa loa]|uniref:Kynurenine-oxoglutarate transaminase n=1 Tax=Loa loa TaxID=7209 RepID=A0A1I7VC69_LOALO|nr:kynurenine-oxoglutarate transaminase [Loa loa]EFO21942.1 kynurenine-oxoglutarate transaminase [Loa loa]
MRGGNVDAHLSEQRQHFSERVANVKPSVWVEFTGLAAECKAVNIGQGFPDTPMPAFVARMLEDVAKHPERTDWHQYSRGFGHPRLTNALSRLYSSTLGVNVDAQQNVLVTVGAYLSLYYSFMGWLNDGDEVIVLDPAFDCYVPQIRMAGGIPVPVVLNLPSDPQSSKDYMLNVKAIEEKINKRTKMIVLNNPHNPTGKLFTQEELEKIAGIVVRYNLLVIADEVYEWHVYGDKKMVRFASLPDMYRRTITIGSAGKAFSVTGWKLGWSIAPAELLEPLRRIHQNCVFTCPTPIQQAVAEAFEKELDIIESNPTESYLKKGIASELIQQRDRMASILRSAGMKPIIPDSGYFMVADFSHLDGPFKVLDGNNDPLDFRFVRWMCREKKLAMIPNSAFYTGPNKHGNDHFIRVCFFKSDKVLDAAESILKSFQMA